MLKKLRLLQALKQPAEGSVIVIKDQTSIDFFFGGNPLFSLNYTLLY